MNKKEFIDKTVKELAIDLKPAVIQIESGIKTTQNHYGRYGALIGQLSNDDENVAKIIALALLEAGGNPQGVRDGLTHLVTGEY